MERFYYQFMFNFCQVAHARIKCLRKKLYFTSYFKFYLAFQGQKFKYFFHGILTLSGQLLKFVLHLRNVFYVSFTCHLCRNLTSHCQNFCCAKSHLNHKYSCIVFNFAFKFRYVSIFLDKPLQKISVSKISPRPYVSMYCVQFWTQLQVSVHVPSIRYVSMLLLSLHKEIEFPLQSS